MTTLPPSAAASDIEWRTSAGLTPYADALAEMEARAVAVGAGEARELLWMLEHPPVYTAGTSADTSSGPVQCSRSTPSR